MVLGEFIDWLIQYSLLSEIKKVDIEIMGEDGERAVKVFDSADQVEMAVIEVEGKGGETVLEVRHSVDISGVELNTVNRSAKSEWQI